MITEHYRTPAQARAARIRRLARLAAWFVVGVVIGLAAPEVLRLIRWIWG